MTVVAYCLIFTFLPLIVIITSSMPSIVLIAGEGEQTPPVVQGATEELAYLVDVHVHVYGSYMHVGS